MLTPSGYKDIRITKLECGAKSQFFLQRSIYVVKKKSKQAFLQMKYESNKLSVR